MHARTTFDNGSIRQEGNMRIGERRRNRKQGKKGRPSDKNSDRPEIETNTSVAECKIMKITIRFFCSLIAVAVSLTRHFPTLSTYSLFPRCRSTLMVRTHIRKFWLCHSHQRTLPHTGESSVPTTRLNMFNLRVPTTERQSKYTRSLLLSAITLLVKVASQPLQTGTSFAARRPNT